MSDRCPLCPGTNNCVPGVGQCNDYTFVGEAPGIEEDRKKLPFVGKTGREVNEHYLPLAGLRRDNIRIVNAIRCLPDTNKHKLDRKKRADRDLLQSCAEWHLYPELDETRPRLIIPMGAFACLAIDPDINLELQHGIPLPTAWGMTFPMYHPAGGIHEPKKMLQIRTDWARLRKHLRGTLTLPTDAYPDPDYRELESPADVDGYLNGKWHLPHATDTETTRQKKPYCVTLSVQAGTGRLIRADNRPALDRLNYHLRRWEGPLLFHNWLFDGEVVEEMGLEYQWLRVVDTMVKVFELGNLPQGLKALSWRELGMKMQDFDDLVTPYSLPIVLDYLRNAMCEEWSTPEPFTYRESGGEWKMKKPQGFRTKLKRFWGDYSKNPEKDVFEQWTNNWEDHHSEVEGVLGAWPGKCITSVPFAKALYYACRDADATLRLWPIIRHMERRVRRTTQERWVDAA